MDVEAITNENLFAEDRTRFRSSREREDLVDPPSAQDDDKDQRAASQETAEEGERSQGRQICGFAAGVTVTSFAQDERTSLKQGCDIV